MFVLLVVLTAVCLVVFAIGFLWGLSERGQTSSRSGAAIGAEMMAEKMAREQTQAEKVPIAQRSRFWGKGWAVERTAEYSYAEMKAAIREGRLRTVLPGLLTGLGMLAFVFFLALTLLVRLDTKIPGLLLLAFVLYGLYIVIVGFIRA